MTQRASMSGTQLAAPLPYTPEETDAKSVLELVGEIQAEVERYGQGHPKGSELVIFYANMCNQSAKPLIGGSGRSQKLARRLLDKALRFLNLDSSFMLLLENRTALALTRNNLGCLLHKQSRFQVAVHMLTPSHSFAGAGEGGGGAQCSGRVAGRVRARGSRLSSIEREWEGERVGGGYVDTSETSASRMPAGIKGLALCVRAVCALARTREPGVHQSLLDLAQGFLVQP